MLIHSAHCTKLEKSLLALRDIVFLKDNNSNYLACNDVFAEYVGLKSEQECVGKNDLMFPWQAYNHIYLKNDQFVTIDKKTCYFIEPVKNSNDKIIDCLTIKAPVVNSNNTIAAVQGISFSLENSSFTKILLKFAKAAQEFKLTLNPSCMIKIITQIIQTNNCKKQWDKETQLFDYGTVHFSIREAQCLHYFLNNYSAEETSKKLFISRKTVETHLAHIKLKLDCNKKSQITNKAIDYGFIDLMFMKF